jgi:dTDP-4-amino-4,6-dideoxygalactose transaminase
VRIAADAPADRDRIIARLRERRIGSSVHFKPLHQLRYYRERYQLADVDFPVASDYGARTLSLPLHPAMDDDDLQDVVDALQEAVGD